MANFNPAMIDSSGFAETKRGYSFFAYFIFAPVSTLIKKFNAQAVQATASALDSLVKNDLDDLNGFNDLNYLRKKMEGATGVPLLNAWQKKVELKLYRKSEL